MSIVENPQFSVIVTFHNQESFVDDAVRSILEQHSATFEAIAVDDGSTDSTRDRLLAFGGAIRTVLRDQCGGAGAARNAGAAIARGRYLMFLDGDDALLPWAVHVYGTIVEAVAPAVVVGTMRWFEDDPPDPGDAPAMIEYFEFADYFSKDRPVGASASAMVMAREVFEAAGRWGAYFYGDDLDLLWKAGTDGPFISVTAPPTTLHRRHAMQTVLKTSEMIAGISRLAACERSGVFPGGKARRRERRAAVGGVVYHWAAIGLRRRSYGDAVRLLVRNWTFVVAAVTVRLRHRLGGESRLRSLPIGLAGPEAPR